MYRQKCLGLSISTATRAAISSGAARRRGETLNHAGTLVWLGHRKVTEQGKTGYRRPSMAAPEPLHVRDALDKLVNQFADPLSFLRELIQNALDAGSREVDVWVDFEATEGSKGTPNDRGVMVIRVEDWGEGMTREIIEKKLTRLFSSAKDGDRTKIGKFGIGFVSVFALQPDAVVIDTSREGEHWRIVFDRERNYSLLEREDPVEGTKIKVLVNATRKRADDIRTRARDVVRYWCKHVRGEVGFQGEVVSEAFSLTEPCVAQRPGEETAIVVGHPRDEGRGIQGFYNRGLTLIEHRDAIIPGLAFKVSSVRLEHTLTRDNVIEDSGYRACLKQVHQLVAGPLCEQVFSMLEAHVTLGKHPELRAYLYRAAAWHIGNGHRLPDTVRSRTVYMQPSGAEVTLDQLQAAGKKKRLLFAGRQSPVTDAVEASGEVVLALPPPTKVVEGCPVEPDDAEAMVLLTALGVTGLAGTLRWIPHEVCQPQPPDDNSEVRDFNPLMRGVGELIREHGGKLSGVALAHFDYPESGISTMVAITQQTLGDVSPMSEVKTLGMSLFSRRRMLVLNADHPAVIRCMELAQHEPEFASYVLVKLFFLGDRLDPKVDATLAKHVMESRCQRST